VGESCCWPDAYLENDEYVAYPADDEEDAKEYVIEYLWSRVFPDITAP
jgi:hypothetical protein